MDNQSNAGKIFSGIFAIVLFVIGVLNVFLVHPVPGIIYFLLSFLYLPPANAILSKRFDFSIPLVVKIGLVGLGIVIIMFTLGVSDLGDMIDKL
jgi:hypothetical protein